jgi:hypothetical protein
VTPEADAADSAPAPAPGDSATEPAAVSSPNAAAAECERAPGDSATEPAAVSSPNAATAEYERAPGDSATEPAAVLSPNAAAAEYERAPGDSATEPAAVSSPAPDAAAAECERAPGSPALMGTRRQPRRNFISVLQIQMENIGISVLNRARNLCRVLLRKKRRCSGSKVRYFQRDLAILRSHEAITTEGPAANRRFAGELYSRLTRAGKIPYMCMFFLYEQQ